ncbi:flavin reductase [Streptomyces sp. R-74717]|uniref:flavin reductase n=1 Tax=Streptomyces TaxID=1883 RepID=UPI0037A62B1D
MKLLCIPCGDQPAHPFPAMTATLGPGVEVVTIEPDGPGDRGQDRPYQRFAEAVDDLAARIPRQVGDAPYAVYGCGTGGLIGYEAARRLVAAGHRSPRHMFVSGTLPHGRRGENGRTGEHTRPDLTFLAALTGAVCVPREFLELNDARSYADARIRRDQEWHSWYREAGRVPRLDCPVTVFTGDEEADAPERDAGLWAELTSGPVTRLPVVGGPHAAGDGRAAGVAERMRSVLLGDGPAPPGTAVTAEVFREAMSHLASPVTVVTAMEDNGKPRAFTASAVCSLSADPPLLLVCMNRTGSTHDVFAAAGHFLVNVLTDEQADVATAFARHDRAEAEAGLVPLEGGLPGVPGASARFLCSREQVLPGGDHSILVGRLEKVTLTAAPPLIHYCRGWHRPSPVPTRPSPDPQSRLV